MSDNDAGLSIIYKGGYVPDLAICIDPTDRFYGWLLARNPLDGRWVSLTKIGANATTLYEARNRIAELEAELQAGRDLMAVVHRDGGDYRQTHGDRKAADDAIAIVSKLRAELAAERERREAAEWVLKEIRIRLHAAGRRPEECWEMSEIDGHLAQFEHRKD